MERDPHPDDEANRLALFIFRWFEANAKEWGPTAFIQGGPEMVSVDGEFDLIALATAIISHGNEADAQRATARHTAPTPCM